MDGMSDWKGITPTFLFFSDGIGTRKILFDREGSTGFLGPHKQTRSWFQIFFIFTPYLGKIPILTNIFQMG